MPLTFIFILAIVFLRNPFSKKKYKVSLINKAALIYRSNPEIVLHDYHYYVLSGLIEQLGLLRNGSVIYFECPGLGLLKMLLPAKTIFLQIEHTLLQSSVNTTQDALVGGLFMLERQDRYLVRIAEYEKLRFADIIFDYSRINLLNIKSSPSLKSYSRRSFCVSPALYSIYTNPQNRNGVITLFGNPDASRRKLFLGLLADNDIAYENIRGVYFGVENIYRKAKIIVNIRQAEGFDTLEELRVLPALRSGAIVISEIAPYVKKTAYSKYIIWGSLKELPGIIAEVERNYEEIHKRIFGDGSKNSSFVKRMIRIEKCNSLSIKRAVERLNSSQNLH
jgi:hypothetical protein